MSIEHPFILHTERLTLRTLDPACAPQVFGYLWRNRAFFEPWSPTFSADYFTIDGQQARLARDLQLLRDDRAVRLWFFRKEDEACQRIIGDAALSNIVRGAFQSCHLGYKIDAAEANHGFMTEAVAAMVDLAFGTLRLHRVEANIIPRNAPSRRVVEKLGFVDEGLSRKYLKINGVWEDHMHYVVLNPNEM
ncbi:MAG TPA: GNAT family protein [Roseiflexaceae bacterium]|jgi:ribosomal-protein-alanine N-acetyltransferase|nr:GNAT family protein [Roseiflexaceae bacterium]